MKSIEERLSVAKTRVTLHHPFWAVIALNVEFIINSLFPWPAATDCAKKIFVNPDICGKFDDKSFMGLIMHELLHIVFMTSSRRGGRDPDLWNIASDYVINLIVVDEMGYEIPEGGCYEKRFLNMSAEAVYDILEQESKSQKSQKSAGKGKQGKGSKTGAQNGKTEQGDSSPAEGNGQYVPGNGSKGFDLHLPFPLGAEQDVKDIVSTAKAIWDSLPDKGRGTIGGTLTDYLKHLLKPQVPWEREFHKYAGMTIGKDDYSLSPPHKRYLMDELIVPALRSYQLGKVVVAIDSSGSISLKALQAFASEVAKMATLVEDITIIVADAQIQQVVKTRDVPDFIKELKIHGRGGTDHRPVFEEIQKQRMEPELFIGLTDGDTYYPEKKPHYPVMWCLTGERTDTPWGKRVFINV